MLALHFPVSVWSPDSLLLMQQATSSYHGIRCIYLFIDLFFFPFSLSLSLPSLPFFPSFLFLSSFFLRIIHRFGRQNYGQVMKEDEEEEREILHALINSPIGHNNQSWMKQNFEECKFIQVKHVSGRSPTTKAIFFFLSSISRKLEQKWTGRHSEVPMRSRHPWWQFNPRSHNASP